MKISMSAVVAAQLRVSEYREFVRCALYLGYGYHQIYFINQDTSEVADRRRQAVIDDAYDLGISDEDVLNVRT